MNEIMSDVKVEGDNDPFNGLIKEKETPTESATEKEPVTDKPASGENTEKPKPFHEDPRWQEMHAKAQKVDVLEKEINDLKKSRVEQTSDIPTWFRNLYGENAEAWKEYSKYDTDRRKEIKEEFRKEQEETSRLQVEQQKHWDTWVEGELKKLETSGKKFDRNELIKVMLETKPSDENGNLDFEAGYKTLEYRQKADSAKSIARKQVADSLSKTSRSEDKPKGYMTAKELRGTSWQKIGEVKE